MADQGRELQPELIARIRYLRARGRSGLETARLTGVHRNTVNTHATKREVEIAKAMLAMAVEACAHSA